jgi:hypothetical protein
MVARRVRLVHRRSGDGEVSSYHGRGGFAYAPWGFVLVIVLPFLVGRALLRSRPRVGAVVIGFMSALLVALRSTQRVVLTDAASSPG